MAPNPNAPLTVTPIGWVSSPYQERAQAPAQGPEKGDISTITIDPKWVEGLSDITAGYDLWVICLMQPDEPPHMKVHPRGDRSQPLRGVFSTRAPVRPVSVSLTLVKVLERKDNLLTVRGLDMLDGTVVLDLKPYVAGVDRPKREETKG
jgi:tRNA-Thr(GGU) m(6)t(6)A37 methyltransferase TsaA